MTEWKRVFDHRPPKDELILVFNTKRQKYEILKMNAEDGRIYWLRQGESVVEVDKNDWWYPFSHFAEHRVYK